MSDLLVEMTNIHKSFFGIEVLHGVNFSVERGEIHALIGENGAGKSTLVKILIGEQKMDDGAIRFEGQPVMIDRTSIAHKLGITMIHQEIQLIPHMSITDNIFTGRESNRFGVIEKKKQEQKALEILRLLDIEIDPNTKVKDLRTAEMQMVEIAKAISSGAKLIIMDEPTSTLSEKEVTKLFSVIRQLKDQHISFIYISHRLEELFEITDKITVLRDGSWVDCGRAKDYSREKLINLMVGRELKDYFPERANTRHGDVILSVHGLTKEGQFTEINFDLYRGEVLGLAGLVGAGRTEIAMTLFGQTRPDAGEVFLKGKKLNIRNTYDAMINGLALIPEDRKLLGLNLTSDVTDNIMMVVEKKLSDAYVLRRKKRSKVVMEMVDKLSIKVSSLRQLVCHLSGGNQQKVVLAKWLLNEPDVLIMDEPTRGIDVGAKAEVYKLIKILASEENKAIILISSDMPELIGLCDRMIVLCEGKITGTLTREEVTQQKILALASKTAAFKQ